MDDSSSLYMCFPCYQLFNSLEEVLSHQLTCHPDSIEEEATVAESTGHPSESDHPSSTSSNPDQKMPSLKLADPRGTALQHGSTNQAVHSSSVRQNQSQKQSSAASAPLIRYQCGDCGSLFQSLAQWQQHRKLRHCAEPSAGSGRLRQNQNQTELEDEGQVKLEPSEGAQKATENSDIEEGAGVTPETQCEDRKEGDGPVSKDHSYGEGAGRQAEVQGNSGQTAGAEARSPGADEEVLMLARKTGPILAEAGKSGNPICSSGEGSPDCQKSCTDAEQVKLKNGEATLTPTAMLAVSRQNFLCMCCGLGFSSELALVAHRKTRHGLEEALHHCPICGENFMSTTLFLYHRRQHREQQASSNPPGCSSAPSSAELSKRSGSELSGRPKRAQGVVDSAGDLPCHQGSDHTPTDGSPPLQSAALLCPGASSLCFPGVAPSLQHGAGPHICPSCSRSFSRRCHFRSHLLSHTGAKRFSCDSCPRAFSYKSNLTRHRLAHQTSRAYFCQTCGKAFTQSGSLKQHRLIHCGPEGEGSDGKGPELELPHSCVDCSSRFKTRAQLLLHRLTHSGKLPFSCSTCGLSFLRKKQLELHLLTHQGILSCPRCSAQFSSQSVLDDHMSSCGEQASQGGGPERGRGRNGGQLECEMCGHRCVTQEGLDLHRLSHSGQTPLRCPFPACRRRFLTSTTLEEHILTHCESVSDPASAKPRPFHCDSCGKDFTTASSLSVHLRIHTGERPYQCTQCGKRFRQIPHLRDHERLHSGARPFSCSVCGKSFVLAARLAEHARTHSGEKPYTCPLCPRAFRSLSNLGKHRKTHGKSPAPKEPGGQDEGEAAVHTILLVQAAPSALEGSDQLCPTQAPTSTVSVASASSPPLLLLAPSIPVSKEADGDMVPIIQHAVEVIVEETV